MGGAEDGAWEATVVFAAGSGSNRRLLAEVFGLVRFAGGGGAGVGGLLAEVGRSEDADDDGSGSGSWAGSGARAGMVKRSPKSTSLTWWRLQVVTVSTSAVVRSREKTHAAPRMRDRMRSSRAGHGG